MPPKTKVKKPIKQIIVPTAYDTFFEVKEVKGKGKGLYAKQALARNTRLLYDGVRIDQKEYNELLKLDKKDPKTQYVAYVIAGGRKGSYIDAHSKHPGSDRWYAGKMNEPDTGVTANMVMVGGINPSFVTVREIRKGEELTICYGSNYVRVGYRKGKCPRKPAWL